MLRRFTDKIKILPNGCHQWTACTTAAGYGRFRNEDGVTVQAHQYAYCCRHGEIPDGMVLDHLCRNRSCVNPDHLEPVTIGENVRRGDNWHRDKTHCRNGHPYNEDNTYTYPDGRRHCKACRRQADIKRRRKQWA